MSIKSSLGRQFGTQFDTVFDVVKSNPIYDKAGGSIPSLDLNFAQTKNLFDSRSVKNLITFSRASKGTYVGTDGFIKLTSENLKVRSEEFYSASYLIQNASITPNAAVAPNGTFTADLLIEDTSANLHNISDNPSAITYETGKTYTFSVYVKNAVGGRNFQFVQSTAAFTGNPAIIVNPQTGDIVFSVGIVANSANSEDVGNGWYRISYSATADATASNGFFLRLNDGTTGSYTGDGVSGVYVWGLQVEEGSILTDYIPTTNTTSGPPRFDHDPVTSESLGLLIEEARTNLIPNSESFSLWTVQGLTQSTAASIVAPDGTTGNVQEFTESSASESHRIFESEVTGNIPCTHSVFVKRGSGARYPYLSSDNSSGARRSIVFDLDTGIVSGDTADFSNTFVIQYPNGWYRIGATITDDGVGNSLQIWGFSEDTNSGFTLPYLGDGTSSLYFWGAQMEVVTVSSVGGEFASSYIPTSGGSDTRAADVAEITGADFAKTNLLTYSDRIDQSIWTLNSGSTLTPNAETAPDGTFTADLIDVVTGNTGGGSDIEQQINPFLADGTPCVFSFYIKSFAGQGSQTLYAKMGRNNTTSSYPFTATETWQRITITDPGNTIGNTKGLFGIAAGLSGTPTAKFYLWGAQLEVGSVRTDYTPSVESFVSRASSATYYDANGVIQTAAVDEARTAAYLPDENGNFISAGDLLLEEARTNLSTYSEDLTFWSASNSTKTFDSSVTAPDGSSGAWVGAVNGTGVSTRIQPPSISYTAGSTYTISVFCKAKGVNTVAVFFNSPDFTYFGSGASIDLTTGTPNSSDLSVTPFPNGWYRISITATASSSGTNKTLCVTPGSINDVNNVSGNGVDGIYIWGGQTEEGSFPTSYIPTTSSTVTRAADVSTSALGIKTWYNQSEGTVFAEWQASYGNQFSTVFQFNAGAATTDLLEAYRNNSNTSVVARIRESDGTQNTVANSISSWTGQSNKIAIGYGSNFLGASVNSSSVNSDTSLNLPTTNALNLGATTDAPTNKFLSGHIKRLAYFNTRLLNSNLQSISN